MIKIYVLDIGGADAINLSLSALPESVKETKNEKLKKQRAYARFLLEFAYFECFGGDTPGVALGGLDLNDLRAQVAQQAGADRGCHEGGQVRYANALQRFAHIQHLLNFDVSLPEGLLFLMLITLYFNTFSES